MKKCLPYLIVAFALTALILWGEAVPTVLWNLLVLWCVMWLLMGLLRLFFRKLKRRHRFWISFGALTLYLLLGMILPASIDLPTAQPQAISYREGETCSEQVRLITDNDEALVQRLRLIAGAKKNITLTSFEFDADESGTDILAVLYAAAERGVQVRVLVDGWSSAACAEWSSAFRALAAHPNAEVKVYNRVNLLLPWQATCRMHDKYLIADDTCYLLGGRNTCDLFLGSYPSERYNDDLEVMVWRRQAIGGDSQEHLQTYFDTLWSQSYCTTLWGIANGEPLLSRELSLRVKYPACYQAYDYAAQTVAAGKITLLSGDTAPAVRAPQIFTDLMAISETSSRRVTVLTPYVMCDDAMYGMLTDVAKGKEFKMLLNSAENGANKFGCADYLREKGRLLETGVSLWEYDGGNSFHGKAMLLDDDLSVVGSMNMDMRSAYLDTELMLVIEGTDVQEQLEMQAEKMLAHSRGVESAKTYAPVDYEVPTLPWLRRAMYDVLKYTSIPVRHLL